jgi:hypothetical protein
MERRVPREHLVPVAGCWIRRSSTEQLGEVRDSRNSVNGLQIKVRWGADMEEWLLTRACRARIPDRLGGTRCPTLGNPASPRCRSSGRPTYARGTSADPRATTR